MKHLSLTTFGSASNDGYTIIEVLIALAIFSIGFLAMGALQSASLRATRNITLHTQSWAVLEDEADVLKGIRFYANNDGINNDNDGATDEVTEEDPDLVAGNHNADTPDGRFTIYWQVENNVPIPAVTIPPANINAPVLPELPAGVYTVSKTISIQVTLPGGNPQTDALASAEFVKTWAESGIP